MRVKMVIKFCRAEFSSELQRCSHLHYYVKLHIIAQERIPRLAYFSQNHRVFSQSPVGGMEIGVPLPGNS